MRSAYSSRIAAAVAGLTCLAFLPTLSNGWVGFDDNLFIPRNPHLSPLSAKNLGWMFSSLYGNHYHPLTWLSLAVNLAVAGPGPLSFHLTDLAIHAGSAVLFFHIARRLLAGSEPAAAAAALFFSIHPLRVESVAWAIERRDVLSGVFYLATILAHLKAVDEPRGKWRPLSWLFYGLSLLSKSIGITLPLALLLLDAYPLKRGIRWKEKLPFFLLAACAALPAFIAEADNGSTQGLELYPLAQRLATAAFGLAFYLRKTLLPLGLLPLYEIPRPFDATAPRFLLSAAAAGLVAAGLIAARKRRPAEAAAGLYYLITVAPVLGLVRFGPQVAADRYSYLSCLGWALLFGAAVERFKLKAAAVVVLTLFGVLTWRQTARWHDALTLWNYALAEDPRVAMGQQHLAYALAGRGRYAEAIPHYREAVQLRPDYWIALNNLGYALASVGRLEEACAEYRRALSFKTGYWEAHSNLGLALGRLKRIDEAEAEFREALRVAPDEPGLHENLGLVYFTRGRRTEAEAEFRRALELDANQRQPRLMLQRMGLVP